MDRRFRIRAGRSPAGHVLRNVERRERVSVQVKGQVTSMHGRVKLQLAALGSILLLAAAGCDFGSATPTPVPAPTVTATVVEQATKPAENTPVPAVSATPAPTGTAVSGGIVATDTPQPLLTPSV